MGFCSEPPVADNTNAVVATSATCKPARAVYAAVIANNVLFIVAYLAAR